MKKTIIAVFALALGACTQIDSGNVGVESTLGQVKDTALPPGVYQTFTKTVHEFSAKQVALDIADLRPKTKDNVTLQDLDITVYYQISAQAAPGIYVKYAGDVAQMKTGEMVLGSGLVRRVAAEAAYNAVSQHDSSVAHTKREEIAAYVRQAAQHELDTDSGKGAFTITNVIVRNLLTDPRLEDSIKQSAEVEFQVRRKQQEIALAQADAERKRVEAEGEARANRIISESLSSSLIELRRIEAQREFAQKGTHTVLLPSGAQPLVQVK